MKTCSKCKSAKPEDDFFRDKRREGGLQAWCKACRKEAQREYMQRTDGHRRRYWANPSGERERHYIRKYGVSIADYEQMLLKQAGCCAICKTPATKTLDIDHCHSTGVVRGLLCTNCNRMVGHAADDPKRLRSAAAYLVKSRNKTKGGK